MRYGDVSSPIFNGNLDLTNICIYYYIRVKDKLLASLLQPDDNEIINKKPLIQDLSHDATTPDSDSISMLDMMMAAHTEAKIQKEEQLGQEIKAVTKQFGNGFRKGFFGSETKLKKTPIISQKINGNIDPSQKSKPTNIISNTAVTPQTPVSTSNGSIDIPTVTKSNSGASSLVLDGVQEAMSSSSDRARAR